MAAKRVWPGGLCHHEQCGTVLLRPALHTAGSFTREGDRTWEEYEAWSWRYATSTLASGGLGVVDSSQIGERIDEKLGVSKQPLWNSTTTSKEWEGREAQITSAAPLGKQWQGQATPAVLAGTVLAAATPAELWQPAWQLGSPIKRSRPLALHLHRTPHARPIAWIMMPFCACMRFSAWSKMME